MIKGKLGRDHEEKSYSSIKLIGSAKNGQISI